MGTFPTPRERIRTRLDSETGRIDRDAPRRAALLYPSPYSVAMSSLGYQTAYRIFQGRSDWCCERVFLPDEAVDSAEIAERPVSYESERPLGDFPLIAVSVAYELEIAGLAHCLEAGGIPALAEERSDEHPLLIAGGPLTFSNPYPLLPFVDVLVFGEADELLSQILDAASEEPSRQRLLERLAQHPSIVVPSLQPEKRGAIAKAEDHLLPARSTIITPHTELSGMFLIEAERGCSRSCQYCVMRRSTNGGMRLVQAPHLLELIPAEHKRVGLVGAAVSDHPRIVEIVTALVDRECHVGVSSLRPDRLTQPLVEALSKGGYRTLTTALDGPSQRLRDQIERRGREEHYLRAASLAREYGMDRLKLYLMIGLPGETEQDIDECAAFVAGLSKTIPIALGISPFCAKRNTPLDRQPYAGITRVQKRLERLRKGLRGRGEVRATSARWSWVEHVLAQGGPAEGRAVYAAWRAGARFSDYRREFEKLGASPNGDGYESSFIAPPVVTRKLPVTKG